MAIWPFKSKPEAVTKAPAIQNETVNITDAERMSDLFLGAKNSTGIVVNADTAMRASSVYACVRLVAGAIGSMPLGIYKRAGDSREAINEHPMARAIRVQPNPMLSASVYWETVASHILLAGNSYSLIGRGRGEQALDLTPLKPNAVNIEEKSGRLMYFITLGNGTYVAYDQDDILHIPGVGWNGLKGLSAIAYAGQNSIGGALAADEYSAKFFANDATPRGYLKFDKKLSPEQAEILRDYWYRKHQGIDNSHLPAIITEGGEFKTTTVSAEDSQLLETRRFQVADICRIFGVPPFMVGETDKSTSWGSGIEQQSIGFIRYTLRPHLTRIEQEINRKLFTGAANKNIFAEFQTHDLMRGDTAGRSAAYQIALGGNQAPGWMTINEVRKAENLPSITDGDEVYKPLTGAPSEPRND